MGAFPGCDTYLSFDKSLDLLNIYITNTPTDFCGFGKVRKSFQRLSNTSNQLFQRENFSPSVQHSQPRSTQVWIAGTCISQENLSVIKRT